MSENKVCTKVPGIAYNLNVSFASQIPKADAHKGYQNMVDFITTVDNEHLAELLEVATKGKGNQYTLRKGEYKNGG